MHTFFALLCFVVVIHWLIFPYPSGLFHWHCGNLTIAPVPAKQPWWIWINTSCEFIMHDCITTTKQSTTKPCAYFLGYTVPLSTSSYQAKIIAWEKNCGREEMGSFLTSSISISIRSNNTSNYKPLRTMNATKQCSVALALRYFTLRRPFLFWSCVLKGLEGHISIVYASLAWLLPMSKYFIMYDITAWKELRITMFGVVQFFFSWLEIWQSIKAYRDHV